MNCCSLRPERSCVLQIPARWHSERAGSRVAGGLETVRLEAAEGIGWLARGIRTQWQAELDGVTIRADRADLDRRVVHWSVFGMASVKPRPVRTTARERPSRA